MLNIFRSRSLPDTPEQTVDRMINNLNAFLNREDISIMPKGDVLKYLLGLIGSQISTINAMQPEENFRQKHFRLYFPKLFGVPIGSSARVAILQMYTKFMTVQEKINLAQVILDKDDNFTYGVDLAYYILSSDEKKQYDNFLVAKSGNNPLDQDIEKMKSTKILERKGWKQYFIPPYYIKRLHPEDNPPTAPSAPSYPTAPSASSGGRIRKKRNRIRSQITNNINFYSKNKMPRRGISQKKLAANIKNAFSSGKITLKGIDFILSNKCNKSIASPWKRLLKKAKGIMLSLTRKKSMRS